MPGQRVKSEEQGARGKAKGKRQKAKGKRQKAKGKRQKAKGSPGWARELTGARPRPCVAALASLVQSACGRARGARHVDRCQAAALKLIWLALRNAVAKWTGSRHDWKSAMTQFALPQFALLYPERFNMGVRISTRLTHGIPDTSGPRGSLAVSGVPSGAAHCDWAAAAARAACFRSDDMAARVAPRIAASRDGGSTAHPLTGRTNAPIGQLNGIRAMPR
ncbi:transposase [Burkholderia pseudomallei]|nr:transposase [Burkholderia pseudomallei]